MIFVTLPSEEPEDHAAASFELFAASIHSRVPEHHSIDLHSEAKRDRAICGAHGRVHPTQQSLCPRCAGIVTSAEEVNRFRALCRRGAVLGIYDAAAVEAKRNATLTRRGAIHLVAA